MNSLLISIVLIITALFVISVFAFFTVEYLSFKKKAQKDLHSKDFLKAQSSSSDDKFEINPVSAFYMEVKPIYPSLRKTHKDKGCYEQSPIRELEEMHYS
jgi:hypothetical protein